MAAPVDERALAELLQAVADGRITTAAAHERLRDLPYQQFLDAKVDHHREMRTGQVEAVFGPGKTPEQVVEIAGALVARASGAVFVTRADAGQIAALRAALPDAIVHERSGLVVVRSAVRGRDASGSVLVVTGGTSDLPVAEEAGETAAALGLSVERIADVGVAGVHRVLEQRGRLSGSDCVIVVAGMEGALASVVAGLTSTPVVAVPTSVGYGANFAGLAALLGMLSSCAPGVAVVNIDNGFGAAQVADRIVRSARSSRARTPVRAASGG
jgi:pyridinium-3,5-biscarboxylic acid mononucleotide synthase